MVHRGYTTKTEAERFPHARGDGPQKKGREVGRSVFSPRPWGWSARGNARFPAPPVFPTPVGMVRAVHAARRALGSFPHARGDGPRVSIEFGCFNRFSPRPWGWSGVDNCGGYIGDVFPTPVGMVRPSATSRAGSTCFPHARGDGPFAWKFDSILTEFSPRPWGWSVVHVDFDEAMVVFPTPVGMVRDHIGFREVCFRFPHARGDGPQFIKTSPRKSGFSPRPWGWSDG